MIILIPTLAFSQSGGKSKFLMFEINSQFGWGHSQIAGDASVPTIGSFNLGIGLGLNIKKITLGLSSDYRILTQYSTVDPTVGNRRGDFVTPISLLFRINFEKIKFGFLFINNGSYTLTNKTADAKKLVYINPSGFRFELIFKKIPKVTPSLFFESVDFSAKKLDGINSDLNTKLNYSNYGVGFKYDF